MGSDRKARVPTLSKGHGHGGVATEVHRSGELESPDHEARSLGAKEVMRSRFVEPDSGHGADGRKQDVVVDEGAIEGRRERFQIGLASDHRFGRNGRGMRHEGCHKRRKQPGIQERFAAYSFDDGLQAGQLSRGEGAVSFEERFRVDRIFDLGHLVSERLE